MPEASIEALQEIIRGFQYGESVWVEAVPVTETFQGDVVWEGVVQVFDLVGHPDVQRCYVWSYQTDDTENRRFFVVAHTPTVNSPVAAVQAAIVAGYEDLT